MMKESGIAYQEEKKKGKETRSSSEVNGKSEKNLILEGIKK